MPEILAEGATPHLPRASEDAVTVWCPGGITAWCYTLFVAPKIPARPDRRFSAASLILTVPNFMDG
jgi:hypothetical protein